MMPDIFNTLSFHLLRPWWLMAILPALAIAWLLLKRRAESSSWAAVIDSELLNELLDGQHQAQKKWPMHALLLAWVLVACAMAGPCFEKNNQVALKQADAVVILLDLSPSMLAQDVQPSRLQAAHYKILDLLHQRREGYTGLIAYSGSAHVVAPLSDDSNTIAALVSTLTPNIMPSIGSRAEDAVSEALQLLENSHFSRGRILLLTDGVVPEALENIQQQLKGKSVELDVIGIGTSAGAPISLPGGNFLKDNSGNILMNKLDETNLQKLAQENGGYYSPLRADDKDIAPLIAPPDWLAQLGNGNSRDASHTVENRQDIGYWLALPCLLLVLLFFRRGVLICLLPLLLLTHQENVRAETPATFPKTWQDWWQTPDQQAATALQKGDVAAAAKQFTDPQWKAYAEYQNGQHKEAAEHFAKSKSAEANYNRGNAQARAVELEAALQSYEKALKQKTDFEDAKSNRDLVKKLLDEQKKQQDQKNKDQNQQQDKERQDQNQQQDQQQQNQGSNDQQQQDQQNQDQQQSQDQQQQDQQQSDAQNEEQSDAQKSEEQKPEEKKQAENDKKSEEEKQSESEKQSEAEKQAQEQKEKQDKAAQENESADSKQPDDKNDPENKDTVRDAEGKSQADKEKQQANEQWLRKVPDDPGGLLKNKFEYYYQLNRQKEARERSAGSSNEEEQRW